MHKRFFVAFIICGITLSPAISQTSTGYPGSISGTVIDQTTKEPIMAANVYISNTTWGSATDADGYYQIRSVPPGLHELVVTIVGYHYESKMILVEQEGDVRQDFSLKPLIYETESTEVLGEIPQDWLDNLELFKQYFLGRSEFAANCVIKNAEVIEFKRLSPQKLEAYTDIPLDIENYALGFNIRTILIDFSLDRMLNRWEWAVKPKFSEMETDDPEQQKIWNQNRLEAYLGSRDHFLMSMIHRNLEEEEFTVYEAQFPGKRSTLREAIHAVLPDDELIKDSPKAGEFILHFKTYLCVVHSFDKISWIRLNFPEVIIDSLGITQQINAFEVYGYWAEYGMASALPKFFTIK